MDYSEQKQNARNEAEEEPTKQRDRPVSVTEQLQHLERLGTNRDSTRTRERL